MIDLGNGVQMVTRAEWGARAAKSRTSEDFEYGVTSHWEGPHMGDFPHDSCASKVRGIQNYHMDSQGWTDIAYSALSCPHGYVFEGRGPNIRTAANGTEPGNDQAGAVCYLGGEGDPFTEAAKRAQRAACDWLDRNGAGSGRNCHRDWKNTACPGDVICSWVKSGMPVTDDVVEEEDMTPEESQKLDRIAAAVVPYYQINDSRFRIQTIIAELFRSELTDEIATATAAKIGDIEPGEVTAEQIKSACKEAIAEVLTAGTESVS